MNGNEKVKVGWVCRHPPLKRQVEELRRLFPECEILHICRTVKDVKEVVEELKKAQVKVAVVVLPLSMISKILSMDNGIVWLWSEMKMLHKCNGYGCSDYDSEKDNFLPLCGTAEVRHVRFVGFKKIKEVKVVLEEISLGGCDSGVEG